VIALNTTGVSCKINYSSFSLLFDVAPGKIRFAAYENAVQLL
jgi:hypothetical protein